MRTLLRSRYVRAHALLVASAGTFVANLHAFMVDPLAATGAATVSGYCLILALVLVILALGNLGAAVTEG